MTRDKNVKAEIESKLPEVDKGCYFHVKRGQYQVTSDRVELRRRRWWGGSVTLSSYVIQGTKTRNPTIQEVLEAAHYCITGLDQAKFDNTVFGNYHPGKRSNHDFVGEIES